MNNDEAAFLSIIDPRHLIVQARQFHKSASRAADERADALAREQKASLTALHATVGKNADRVLQRVESQREFCVVARCALAP